MYGLLTKREVNMARYWPISFFCVCMDQDGVKVLEYAKKKKKPKPISRHLDRTSLVNQECITYMDFDEPHSAEDNAIFPARVANHSAELGSPCPLTEPAM